MRRGRDARGARLGVLGTSPASGRGILALIELHAFF
jgi:hypothetical protein